jgi:hypothetical protein
MLADQQRRLARITDESKIIPSDETIIAQNKIHSADCDRATCTCVRTDHLHHVREARVISRQQDFARMLRTDRRDLESVIVTQIGE